MPLACHERRLARLGDPRQASIAERLQRNGRVDRIQSKSELVRRPIHIFEPFLAATADEKMYRVVKDRERWFQVVMGDDFKLSEATTERRLLRLPLPTAIAKALSFELSASTN